MIRTVLLAACLAAPVTAWAQPAPNCLPREDMRHLLGERWGEGRTSEALGMFTGAPAVFETWRNASTGTWTLTIKRPDGMACIVASGIAWSAVDDAPANASEQRS